MKNSVNDKKLISIVIPCYRSEKTIKNVVDEIDEVFSKQSRFDYEVILVNDGSSDNTFGVISAICDVNPHVTGIDLSKNFGQSNAKMAGMKHANGEYMISMDDDGQHPAAEIFRLIDKIDEGYDIVYANFQKKKQSVFKRFTSWLSDKMMVCLGNRKSDYHVSSFIAFSSFAVKAIQNSESPVPAGAIYVSRISNKITSIPIEQRKRIEGKSNYSLKRLFSLWRNNLTHFSTKILDLAFTFGLISLFACFVCVVAMIINKILNPEVSVALMMIISIMLLLSGLIMIFIGILGDYIGKIYLIEIKKPGHYIRTQKLSMYAKNKSDSVKNSEE